ncbi:MAG: 2-hydroxyacid dehydrogenase [Bryobacteraceae bacterium]|nr:MAG: 2-hydroxyacid dehydrogenase [Bryobacteraceae bacterium]
MKASTLLVLNDPAAPHLKWLDRLPAGTRIAAGASAEAFRQAAPEADVMLVGAVPRELFEEVFAMAPRLEWVHVMWAGLDSLLFPALAQSPVTLTNGRGVFARSLAEFVIAGMLWFAKDIRRMRRQQRERKWEKFTVEELHGRQLGIIGHGSIGRAVAALATAFGMKVIGVGRRSPREEFDEVIAASDFILVSAPLTPETRGLIGESEFRRMRPGAVLINVGRGPVVQEEGLIAALRDGRIRGAVLDVYDEEPLPADHPFWSMENVLLSPHCADNTPTWLDEAMQLFVENFERYVKGEPLKNIVDKEAGY